MPRILLKICSTFFYVGCLPFIPGTFGSLAGIFVYYLFRNNALGYAFAAAGIITAGFLVAGREEREARKSDPRYVVIDEVAGMLVSLIFLPYDLKLVILAFALFRILDTLKPYPAGRLERFKGSLGIMGDDLIAGLYTNLILQVVVRVISFKAS